jgi:hypothetical protein
VRESIGGAAGATGALDGGGKGGGTVGGSGSFLQESARQTTAIHARVIESAF